MRPPENEKADESGNSHRPNDSTPDQRAETDATVTDPTQSVKRGSFRDQVHEFQRKLVVDTVTRCGTITAAAEELKIDRSALSKLAKRYGANSSWVQR